MNEEKINILSVEKTIPGLDSINDHELLELLKKMSYECKVDKEDMRGFYDMFFQQVKPPNIDSFKEILITYILKDPKFTPYIKLDLSARSTQPWDYYIPKESPKDTVRVTLLQPKRVLVEQVNGKLIPLIMPQGQIVDIKNINMINLNLIKSMFRTVEYHQVIQNIYSNYRTRCHPCYSSKLTPLKYIDLDEHINHFIEQINNIGTYYRKQMTYNNQFIFSSLINNLLPTYIKYIQEGNLDTITLHNIRLKRDTQIKTILNNKLKSIEEVKNNIMKDLIKLHFPEVYKLYHQRVNYKDIFKKLDNKSVNFIQREYETKEEFKKAMEANRCPHLEILRKFRLAKEFKIKRKWYLELKPFISNPNETKHFHTCKRCKFNIICSHITQSIEGVLNNTSGMEIREKLDWYRDRMDKSQHQYLCRICTEVLFDLNYDEIQGETYKILYTEIFKYLWSQSLNIFVTLRITPKVNIFDFCSIIVYGILPIITRSSIPDIKNKMNSYIQTGQLDVEFKVFIILYIYAYILNMIRFNLSNPGSAYVHIQLEENIKGKNISNYAEAIVARFLTIHRSTFNQITEINTADLLITIYTELAKSDSTFAIEQMNSLETIIFNEVIKNTIFNYSFQIATIMEKIDVSNKELNISEYENIVNEILGMRIQDIAKGKEKNTYLQVYQPSYDIPAVKKYQSIIAKPKLRLNDISKIIKGRTIFSFGLFMRKFSERESKTDDIFDQLIEPEKKIKYIANIYYKILTSILNATKKWKRRKYTDDKNITAIFGENGKEHKWDVLIYDDGTEIKRGTGDGIKKYKEIVDYKDSTTGIIRSETQNQNVKKTKDAYTRNTKKKVFFNFYKIKCPENGIHNFSNGKSCSKCGLIDGHQQDSYYTKYYDTFLTEISESQGQTSALRKKGLDELKHYKPIQWKYNIRPIIEVSKLISQPQSVIESIGAMEGRTVDDVKLNRNRPPFPSSLYDPQLTLPISHYQWAVSTYNRFIFDNMDNELTFLKHIKSAGINMTDVINNKGKFPKDIYVSYNNILYWVLQDDNIKIEDKYLCVIEMLCSFIIDLSKISNITKEIAKYLMDSIIKDEFYTTMGSKHFDRTVFKTATSIFLGDQDISEEVYENLDESKFEAEGDLSYEDVDIIHNT